MAKPDPVQTHKEGLKAMTDVDFDKIRTKGLIGDIEDVVYYRDGEPLLNKEEAT